VRIDLARIEAFLIDMDGVLYRGDTPVPGMQDFLKQLVRNDVPHLFVTNNSSMTPEQYTQKLTRMGAPAAPEHILTSALVTASFLARRASSEDRVFMIGHEGLRQALLGAGLHLTERDGEATYVVAGIDRDLSWEKLAAATLAIRRGAPFLGTNGDRTFPTERGLEPGAGAVLAFLEAASGVRPQVFGKPEPAMFDDALQRLGTPRERTAMIGDRYETDILGASRAGLVTLAVTSGVYERAYFEAQNPVPDGIFASVAEIGRILDG
jgi:4-nitrophenyl phosphatase